MATSAQTADPEGAEKGGGMRDGGLLGAAATNSSGVKGGERRLGG